MAIVKKPGAGITRVFNQTTGKLDSAIFSVFGGNLKTLLNQFGVNKLSDLKNIDLSKLDIDMFEELYYDPEKELDSEEDYEL